MSLDRAYVINRIQAIIEAHTTPAFTVVVGEPLALGPDGSPFCCFWYLGEGEPPEGRMTLGNVMVMERFQVMCFWHRQPELATLEALEAEIWQANRTLKAAFRSDSFLNGPPNLIANGGFEIDAAGWSVPGTNTVERVAATDEAIDAKYGTHVLKCTYQDATTLAQYNLSLTAAPHAHQVAVYVPTAYDGAGLSVRLQDFVGAGSIVNPNVDMSIRDQWQVVDDGTLTPVSGDLEGTFRLVATGTPPTPGKFVYIDGAKVELGTASTAYVEPDDDAIDIDITDSQVDYGVFPIEGGSTLYRTLEFELHVKDLGAEAIAP